MVSDGHSHDDPVPASEAIRKMGVTLIAVGIGGHINRGVATLRQMRQMSHIFLRKMKKVDFSKWYFSYFVNI